MEQGMVVISKLKDRIKNLTQLKEFLLDQQKALVSGNHNLVSSIAEKQLKCIENIHLLEQDWKINFEELRNRHEIPPATTQHDSFCLIFNGNVLTKILGLQKNLAKLAEEIDTIKKNNFLLLHNSISLIQTTLKYLQGNRPTDLIYNPRKKQVNYSGILNKKI